MFGKTALAPTAASKSCTVFRYWSVERRINDDTPGAAVASQLTLTPPGLLPTGMLPGEPEPPSLEGTLMVPPLAPVLVSAEWQPSVSANSAVHEVARKLAWFALIALHGRTFASRKRFSESTFAALQP